MADLALTFDGLRAEIGYFLGYGRDPDGWTSDQENNLNACVHAGYRQFLTPPPGGGRRASYQWTFLRPNLDVGLVADVRDYLLPAGFQWFEGDLSLVTSSYVYAPVKRRGVGELEQLRSQAGGSFTGTPYYAAVRPKSMEGGAGTGQRMELMLYPTPNTSYTLRGQAQMNPPALSKANPYPYGGPAHAETLKQSCLAAAERDIDDAPQGGHMAAFMQCLAASIDADCRLRPSNLGYAGDGERHVIDPNSVAQATWNGTLYEG